MINKFLKNCPDLSGKHGIISFYHKEFIRWSQSSSSKYFEDMKTKPFGEDDNHTWVSPPHPKSNLRLKVFPSSSHLTKEEKDYFQNYEKVQDWNQEYWEAHNSDFTESKKVFVEKIKKEMNLSEKDTVSDNVMNHFYQDFLQKNHKKHLAYNKEWYKKNFYLIYLAAKVNIYKIKKFFHSR